MSAEDNFIAKYDKLAKYLGARVEEATPDYARVTMPLREEHKNGMGMAHGGTIFTLADLAFGAASNAGRSCGVVNMNSAINYLRPGRIGPLAAEARAIRLGSHILSYEVRVFDSDGALIATLLVTGYATDVPLPGTAPVNDKGVK